MSVYLINELAMTYVKAATSATILLNFESKMELKLEVRLNFLPFQGSNLNLQILKQITYQCVTVLPFNINED